MTGSPWQTLDYARRYDAIVRGAYPFHKQAAVRLVEFAAPQSGQRVLDLGAGTGLVAERAIQYQPRCVVLADSSAAMLRVAREHLTTVAAATGTELRFVTLDATRLSREIEPASVDIVIASYAFGWFSDPQAVFSELAKVVTPGGTLVFDVPPPADPPPHFLATAPVFQVFSREFGALLRERLGYAPAARGNRPVPLDYRGYVKMAEAAGFAAGETLRVDVPYTPDEVEAVWRYGWQFSAAANPALARLDPVRVEAVVEEAIERVRGSREYDQWQLSGEPLWETYAAVKVIR